MSLRRFAVSNYRCFRDRQEVRLAPVTVVLGKNNSGKSALVRAPLLLAAGIGVDTEAPFDLERLDVDPVDSFTDLIFEHRDHGRIDVELEVAGTAPFELAATVQYVSETQEAFVSDLTLDYGGRHLELVWRPGLFAAPPRSYEVSVDRQPKGQAAVEFRGLVPVAGLAAPLPRWGERGQGIGTVRYLSPYRERLQRQHRLPLGQPSDLGAQGQGVSAVLADDKARRDGEVIGIVNSYLTDIVPDWELAEVPVGPLWATVLARRSRDGVVQVSLSDAGAGLAQVLPILVQCALDQHTRAGAAPVQIIEEPEMHLHPAAHAELADLYLRTAEATGTRFLVETHSETLLLRLRRRIAEGIYPPEMVSVYVVDQRDGVSSVRPVDVDRLGNLSDEWPEGYFSTDYQDVRAIAAAQLDGSGNAA